MVDKKLLVWLLKLLGKNACACNFFLDIFIYWNTPIFFFKKVKYEKESFIWTSSPTKKLDELWWNAVHLSHKQGKFWIKIKKLDISKKLIFMVMLNVKFYNTLFLLNVTFLSIWKELRKFYPLYFLHFSFKILNIAAVFRGRLTNMC